MNQELNCQKKVILQAEMEKLSKERQKWIRSLQLKKNRDEEAVFVVEGEKSVLEGIQISKHQLLELVSLENCISLIPSEFHSKVKTVTEKELDAISDLRSPNKFLAVFKKVTRTLSLNESTIILDGIQDPGNMGTILRLADWFGINQIVCSNDTVDCYNPKVIQASMGAIFRISVQYTDLKSFIPQYKSPIFAAFLNGENYKTVLKPTQFALLMGNEGKGIRPEIEALVENRITIPRIGEAESLNVSTATAILLAEFCL